jgi:tryptophanase
LSKKFFLERISQIHRDFGMIASRKRLWKSLKEANKDVVKRTWTLSTRQGRENERVLVTRVTMMEVDHI